MMVDGTMISGRPDLWKDEEITDYKITSVWSFMFGLKSEWERAQNIYKALYKTHGFKTKKITIHAILRDWKISESYKGPVYSTGMPKVSSIFNSSIWCSPSAVWFEIVRNTSLTMILLAPSLRA